MGCSLFLYGCNKEERREASQVSQGIWDKLDGKDTSNKKDKELSKIEEKQSSSNFSGSQVVFDYYLGDAAFNRGDIGLNRQKIDILGYPHSMNFYVSTFGNDSLGSSCCINLSKSNLDIPVEIDYSQSQSYIVVSRPVLDFKKAPCFEDPSISLNKLGDNKLAKKLISIASKEPKLGHRFDPKKAEVYEIFVKDNPRYRSSMQFFDNSFSSYEKGIRGFVQFNQSSDSSLDGLCLASICDFKLENKEKGTSANLTSCVTMARVPSIFPDAVGCWMRNSDRSVIELSQGYIKMYTRNSSSGLYSSSYCDWAEYDKKKDIIYLAGKNKLPAIGRVKVDGGVYLSFIDENGLKEAMAPTSLR